MAVAIKAYVNCDRAYVVWQPDRRVSNCLGYALLRQRNGTEEVVETWVGFEGDQDPKGTHKPSTVWPIQKYMWADYFVNDGDRVRYRVVPMVGTPGSLKKRASGASDWTDEVQISAAAEPGFSAYFNRGIVASQWLTRRLEERGQQNQATSLEAIIDTPGDRTRNDLSDPLRLEMLDLLADAKRLKSKVYAALFELNDPELLPALCALGANASVILANGATKRKGEDENADARQALRDANVQVFDRLLPTGHLGHNKFVVVCSRNDRPQRAWTGSTNWSTTGLCTQANNGILIESASVAGWFKEHWEKLRDAKSEFPGNLVALDVERSGPVRKIPMSAWFTPVAEFADLVQARTLIDEAQDGILFLMFNPGPRNSLFNAILDRTQTTSEFFDPNLYIHGVMNQDPGTTKNPIDPVVFFHRGKEEPAGFDVVLPANINEAFAFWRKELLKLPTAHAMVHSKIVVLDPFGANPVVMTGSHNLGPKASSGNDDNLVIVRNAPRLAAAYAVTIMGVYNDYRWRFRTRGHRTAAPPVRATTSADPCAGPVWRGLRPYDCWQDFYFTDPSKLRELDFWLGRGTGAG